MFSTPGSIPFDLQPDQALQSNIWDPPPNFEGYVDVMPVPYIRPVPPVPQANGDSKTDKPGTERPPESDEVLIAVMGATGSGKTTFINEASGSNLKIGAGLRSCTNVVQIAESFYLEGRKVVMIDTPGFDDTTKSDTEILRMIAAFLTSTYEKGIRLAGVIYIHRISDFRMGGISTRNFKMFRELCGESTLKNVIILTNMWGQVNREVGEARERELANDSLFFKPVLDKGAQMLRHDNTTESAQRILCHIINNHPITLQIQREIVDEGKDILQTAAGEELNRELLAQLRKHEKDMIELQREMKEAIDAKDEETRREIEAEANKLKAEMNRVRTDAEKLAETYEAEKTRMEHHMNQMMEESRKEMERNEWLHREKIRLLEERLNEADTRSKGERQALENQLRELRRGASRSSGGWLGVAVRAIGRVFGF